MYCNHGGNVLVVMVDCVVVLTDWLQRIRHPTTVALRVRVSQKELGPREMGTKKFCSLGEGSRILWTGPYSLFLGRFAWERKRKTRFWLFCCPVFSRSYETRFFYQVVFHFLGRVTIGSDKIWENGWFSLWKNEFFNRRKLYLFFVCVKCSLVKCSCTEMWCTLFVKK